MANMKETGVDTWLRRIVLGCIVVFVGMLCIFVWRLSMVVYRVESDLQQVTSTAANISQQVNQVSERLEVLGKKTSEALRLDELENVLDEVAELRSAEERSTPLAPKVEAEIDYLLSYIKDSGRQYEYSGKVRSARRFHLQLSGKYKMYRKTLTSAEDFIEKVATNTLAGNPYYIVDKDQRQRLDGWLVEALRKYRASGGNVSP